MRTLRLITLFAGIASLAAASCSSNSPAPTAADNTATTDKTMDKAGGDGAASGDLALCTGGAVPVGATSCKLDLGTGTDSHWSDTDGVDPGTAGCHDEYEDNTCQTVKNGRAFGEFCLDEDRLVESNPGAGECHTHGGDLGKPDVVSCSAWCTENGSTGGTCQGDVSATGASGDCVSARCVCAEA